MLLLRGEMPGVGGAACLPRHPPHKSWAARLSCPRLVRWVYIGRAWGWWCKLGMRSDRPFVVVGSF
jgi:hypothetical protein